MTRSIALALCAAFAVPLASQTLAQGVDLPLGFDGLYAPEGLPCDGTPRITVKNGTFIGEGWSWTVNDLIEFPGEPNKVDVGLTTRSGGDERTDGVVITLSGDGQGPVLVFDYADGTRNIWRRCDDLP